MRAQAHPRTPRRGSHPLPRLAEGEIRNLGQTGDREALPLQGAVTRVGTAHHGAHGLAVRNEHRLRGKEVWAALFDQRDHIHSAGDFYRLNTVFRFHYNAWLLLSIAGYGSGRRVGLRGRRELKTGTAEMGCADRPHGGGRRVE